MDQRPARLEKHDNVKLRVSSVPFSAIPHQSKLFLDYLRDPAALKRYYPNAVKATSDLAEFIPEVLRNYKTDRNTLCDALAEINSAAGAGEITFKHIDMLRDPDTVAVVTGQQAGLFTGPLYTIYKALSVIKMAEQLNAKGSKAVPVFWVASEDHDFDEVSKAYFIENDLIEAKYQPVDDKKNAMVGDIGIDGSMRGLIQGLFDSFPQTQFSGAERNSIEQLWSEGTLFGKAFSRNLAAILERFGLIIIDPMNSSVRTLAAPIYADAIRKSDEIVNGILQKNRELENEGYHAQVLVEEDYFPLFWIDDQGRRTALRKTSEDIYSAKGEENKFSLEELVSIASDEPQRFSPGVMLRPVVQDYLLPTVSYFGGSAEIAYFAQNVAVYKTLDRPVTPIAPRQSFTIVEAKHRRTFEKLGFVFADMFVGSERLLENIGQKQLSDETAAAIVRAEGTITDELEKLREKFSLMDPTLVENLDKRRRKIMYHIAVLKKKASLAALRKDETIERKVKSAFDALLPKGQLQERVLNVHSFLNKYGPFFIDMLYDAVDLTNKDHRVIDL